MRNISFGEQSNILMENILLSLRVKRIIKYFNRLDNIKTIGDIGCGYYAKSLQKLLKIFPRIDRAIGIDISVNEKLNNEKIKLIKSDINYPLPLEKNLFDAVISLAVIEHLENFNMVIKEMYRVLKHGGYLFLTTPSPCSKPILEFLAFKLKLLDEVEIRDHKRNFSKNDLKDILEKNHFKIMKIKSFQFGLNNFVICKK